jgi:alpha-1,6-mannosyltransferase
MTVDQALLRPAASPVLMAAVRELRGVGEAWRIPAVRRGTLGTALIMGGSLTPAFLPDVNPFSDIPVIGALQSQPGRVIATAVLMVGVLLLLDAWLRVRPRAGRPSPTRHILWLWSAPILFAPPLFSRDAYSYAGQGRLVHIELDPYRYGPAGVAEQYSQNVDPMWLYTPAPYGPLMLQIQHLIVDIAGPLHPYAAAVAMRIPALVGVALIAVLLPKIAGRLGYDVPATTWLAVLNPLVVMHLVGGAHNDALMLGLMVAAVWLALEQRPWLAVIAVALAGGIKAPGFLAILAVVAIEARRRKGAVPTMREVMRSFTRYGGGMVAAFCVLTVVCGLGFGWIGALGVPSSIRSVLSPPTVIGIGLENLLSWLQVPDVLDTTVTAVQRIGTLVGVALAARVAWRLGPVAPVRALAWVVTILVLTGAVVHPWYVLWCGILLGMTEGTRFWPRRVMIWVTAGLVVYSTVDAAFRNGALAFGVTAALGLAWVALGHDRDLDREQDRDRVAALGRWSTVQGWYAVVAEALSGPPVRTSGQHEQLDREPVARS